VTDPERQTWCTTWVGALGGTPSSEEKQRVRASCSRVVCLRLKGNLVVVVIIILNSILSK